MNKELDFIEKELEKTKRNYEEWKGYVASDKDLEVETKYQEELSQMIANARCSFEEKIATLESIKAKLQAFDERDELERFTRIVIKRGLDFLSIGSIREAKNYDDYLDLTENLLTKTFDLTEDEFNFAKEMIEKYGKN